MTWFGRRFDCIIAANGRRSNAPEWLRDVGIEVPDEVVEDTGIIYYSRFTVYLMVLSSPLVIGWLQVISGI